MEKETDWNQNDRRQERKVEVMLQYQADARTHMRVTSLL